MGGKKKKKKVVLCYFLVSYEQPSLTCSKKIFLYPSSSGLGGHDARYPFYRC